MRGTTTWTDRRFQRLLERYNQQFWEGKLADWRVALCPPHGLYGECDRKKPCLYIQPEACINDRQVRATLIHEMSHAATNGSHGALWRAEMTRVRADGAPTEPLDFLVPYTARWIVTSFIDAARSGERCWEAVWTELAPSFELCGPDGRPTGRRASRIRTQCKRFFDLAVAKGDLNQFRAKRRAGTVHRDTGVGRRL